MFSSAQKRTLCFIVLIVAAFSLSGCPGTDEAWALVQLLTKGEQTVSTTQTAEVRNCGGLPEKKTVQCSAGTESNMSISLGGSVLTGIRGTLAASVAADLGFNRTSGQTLELETPPTGFIAQYRITTDYRVISGRGLARSSSGRKQEISYTFQADCALRINSREVISCEGQGKQPPSTVVVPPTQGKQPPSTVFVPPTAPVSTQPPVGDYCYGTCWRYDENARTMTWTGPTDGREDICQGDTVSLGRIRSGWTAILGPVSVPGEIEACVLTLNGQSVVNSCDGVKNPYRVAANSTFRVTSQHSDVGGFRWKPQQGYGYRTK